MISRCPFDATKTTSTPAGGARGVEACRLKARLFRFSGGELAPAACASAVDESATSRPSAARMRAAGFIVDPLALRHVADGHQVAVDGPENVVLAAVESFADARRVVRHGDYKRLARRELLEALRGR